MEEVEAVMGGWGQLGLLTGIIILLVTSLVRGLLKPKSHVDELREQWEKRLADRDALIAEQRETIRLLDKRNELLAEQVRHMTEGVRLTTAVVQALPAAIEGASP